MMPEERHASSLEKVLLSATDYWQLVVDVILHRVALITVNLGQSRHDTKI